MRKIIHKLYFFTSHPALKGWDLPQYGIPYICSVGMIFEKNLDQMLEAIRIDPSLHIVSYAKSGWGYNCYKPGMSYYTLCRGDADPEIEITDKWPEDRVITKEEVAKFEAWVREMWVEAKNDPEWAAITGPIKFDPTF